MESSCTVILWMEIGRRGVSLGDKAFTSIKGTASLKYITEEVIRFSLENASRDPCVFQGDSERAMRQVLRTAQQVRTVMGLPCEIRLAVDSMNRMARQNVECRQFESLQIVFDHLLKPKRSSR